MTTEQRLRRALAELHESRARATGLTFGVHGIFAGLLLSGVIGRVPIIALGVGLAVTSAVAACYSWWHWRQVAKWEDE